MPILDHNHLKTSNNEHDWKRVTYLNVLLDNRTQKQLQYSFLIILQKFNELPIVGTIDVSGCFHQKQ